MASILKFFPVMARVFSLNRFVYNETMSKNQLKLATELDFAHIVFIQKNDGYDHAYYLTEDRIERLVEAGEKFFVFYNEDQFVGMAGIHLDVRIELHFFSVIVSDKQDKLATEMLTSLMKEIRSYKTLHRNIFCYSEPDAPLVKLLKNNGFEMVGFYKDRYKNGKDAVILERKI